MQQMTRPGPGQEFDKRIAMALEEFLGRTQINGNEAEIMVACLGFVRGLKNGLYAVQHVGMVAEGGPTQPGPLPPGS